MGIFSYYYRDSGRVKAVMKGLSQSHSYYALKRLCELCVWYVGTTARQSFAGSICCESCPQFGGFSLMSQAFLSHTVFLPRT